MSLIIPKTNLDYLQLEICRGKAMNRTQKFTAPWPRASLFIVRSQLFILLAQFMRLCIFRTIDQPKNYKMVPILLGRI